MIIDQNYTADIELAGLKLTATDINGKQSVISYDIHVGYYYYTVLMSLMVRLTMEILLQVASSLPQQREHSITVMEKTIGKRLILPSLLTVAIQS